MATMTFVVKAKGANTTGGFVLLIPKATETKLNFAIVKMDIADQTTYDAMPAVNSDWVVTLP